MQISGEQTAYPKTRSVFSQAVTETRSITVQTDEEDFSEQKAQFKELQSHFFNQIAALETSSAHRIDVLDNRIRSVSQGACNLLTVSDMALCTSNRDEHLHSIMQSSLSEQLQRTVVNLHESEERLKLMMWFHSVCMTQQITSANSNNSTTAHQEIQLAPNGELVALLEECYQALHDTE